MPSTLYQELLNQDAIDRNNNNNNINNTNTNVSNVNVKPSGSINVKSTGTVKVNPPSKLNTNDTISRKTNSLSLSYLPSKLDPKSKEYVVPPDITEPKYKVKQAGVYTQKSKQQHSDKQKRWEDKINLKNKKKAQIDSVHQARKSLAFDRHLTREMKLQLVADIDVMEEEIKMQEAQLQSIYEEERLESDSQVVDVEYVEDRFPEAEDVGNKITGSNVSKHVYHPPKGRK